jgi:hypothetical protein
MVKYLKVEGTSSLQFAAVWQVAAVLEGRLDVENNLDVNSSAGQLPPSHPY